MQSVLAAKEILAGDTPLFFVDVQLANGTTMHWSTRTLSWSGAQYDARVIKHNLFEAQLASDTGIGGVPKLSFELANADSELSQVERQTGFKGAQVTVRVAFVDVGSETATSDAAVVFRGIANSPDLIGENTFRLSAMNRMTMQRAIVPDVRVQRMCPWRFPATASQRAEAVDGAARGRYSPLYRCGYSPDLVNGTGNLNGNVPFTSCSNSRSDCEQRGMFVSDNSNRPTGRFGGFEFVPASILVRGAGQPSYQLSAVQDNQARYNDFVPLIYGTQWHSPDIVFTRNDGNLTRMEVLLGMGELEGVLQVLVEGIEIPRGQSGHNMTSTGWYNVVTWGSRNGTRNGDFADANGVPLGDPYGSMAYLSVVVPNRVNNGTSLPKVQVLVQGLKLYRFDSAGNFVDETFTDNPAWVLLDVLMRSGWLLDDLDKGSFARAAAYADETISVIDPAGGMIQLPRFQCNFAMKDRRSVGDVIRSIRNSARLYLIQNSSGLIEARVENSFSLQQPSTPAGSNASSTFNGGWPAYEFDESSIARKRDGTSSVVLSTKGAQDTPNRLSIEFQDSLNQYQQDSLSLADGDDVDLCGQEVATSFDAVGISTFSQAARMVLLALNRSVTGNRYISFDTSVKALGLAPGDLITVSYAKEDLIRVPFRINKIAPGSSFRTATITAQIHDDSWYSDSTDVLAGGLGRQPGQGTGLPSPVIGTNLDGSGNLQYGIAETESTGTDGTSRVALAVSFVSPSATQGNLPSPLLGFVPTVVESVGALPSESLFYYAVSAVDSAGLEGAKSFVVQAATGATPATYTVNLSGIQLPSGTAGFHVYRGADPRLLLRIGSNVTPAGSFTDSGLMAQAVLAPDTQFDHVNAYWRWELLPECSVTGVTGTSVSHFSLQLVVGAYKGNSVRITRGKGAGQERLIESNSVDTLTVSPEWVIPPDATSFFAIAETAWRFGCTSVTSPISFDVPERIGTGVHVLLRAASIGGYESAVEVSPVTRWALGQSGALLSDSDVPPTPVFGVSLSGRRPGTIQLSTVAFPSLLNTRGIVAATYALHYFDELNGTTTELTAAAAPGDTVLSISGGAVPGSFVQLEQEILQVTQVSIDGSVQVKRGLHGTTAASHMQTATCYLLSQYDLVLPFIKGFFGSAAAGSWSYFVDLPGVRMASAELFFTNLFGAGPVAVNNFTALRDFGLRTLAGGQFSFQITGFLAIQTGAAPDVLVDRDRCIGNIFATLRAPSIGATVNLQINVNGQLYGALQFDAGETNSSSLRGFGLTTLRAGDRLSLDIVGVGTTSPGSDLTVIISL